uniref:Uncharacterized protein n=1 Tax=Arundo donax TaxID=35708 RepID=A0A0A9F298_ARUDO
MCKCSNPCQPIKSGRTPKIQVHRSMILRSYDFCVLLYECMS